MNRAGLLPLPFYYTKIRHLNHVTTDPSNPICPANGGMYRGGSSASRSLCSGSGSIPFVAMPVQPVPIAIAVRFLGGAGNVITHSKRNARCQASAVASVPRIVRYSMFNGPHVMQS